MKKRSINFSGLLVGAMTLAFLLLITALTSCGFDSDDVKGSQNNPVKFGVVGVSDLQWSILKEDLQNEGIYVEYSDFTDYQTGLDALNQGELDINQSVHLLLLSNYNVKHDSNLRAIGSKAVFPLGLYPNPDKNIGSVDDFKPGDIIVIPDDVSNAARALLELQDAGLIVLKNGGSPFSTLADIDTTKSQVQVKTVDAGQVGPLLNDPQVSAGITNNDHIRTIGISPSDSILTLKLDGDIAKYYTNVFAVHEKDAHNDVYKRIVDIATHDKRWLDEVLLESGNTALLTTDITSEKLSEHQDELQQTIKKQ